mgnify:CR=1 FL=1
MKVIKKTKNQKDTATISFRVDLSLKQEWDKFCKENNVSRAKTITKLLKEVINNES